MSGFRSDLFTRPDQYEESLLRERKACVKYWEDASKAEFNRTFSFIHSGKKRS